jgi:protein-tyrosine-phosphatase
MTETPTWATLRPDETVALRAAALRLADDFSGVYGTETIDRFLHSSFDQFAGRATVTKFLPLMAERFARQRLRALAKIEGLHDDGKPTVLFLCVHNAGRSQMAMGFFAHLAGDAAVAWSGGSEPGTAVNPAAVAAMRERGIDISGEFPKPWTDETVRAADVVITMGCGDACPIFPGKRSEEWVLDDPAGQDLAAVRPIRDDVERRVRALLDDLGVPSRT